MIQGKAVIAQGGGPTAVINQTLAGAIIEAKKSGQISELYGAIHGVRGIVGENFIDLTMVSDDNLKQVSLSPASALLSTRDKPDHEYCERIIEVFKAHEIRFFYYIGGNDSADTCRIVSESAKEMGYELTVVHIPKTIDNDLRVTDHTPGFGSAAKFVANCFSGINLDNRALPGIYIGIIMGRDAGFLTAASALAHRYSDDAPHLIYIPESTFDPQQFLTHVETTYQKHGRAVIAISEGIRNAQGEPIAATLQDAVERDSHGNVQLSGNGALGDSLISLVKKNITKSKVRGDTFGYLQRSFAGCTSLVDAREARTIGEMAIKHSLQKDFTSGSIAMIRKENYVINYETTPLETVAHLTKPMDSSFYNAETASVTPQFLKYIRPIVGELHQCEQLTAPSIKPLLRK